LSERGKGKRTSRQNALRKKWDKNLGERRGRIESQPPRCKNIKTVACRLHRDGGILEASSKKGVPNGGREPLAEIKQKGVPANRDNIRGFLTLFRELKGNKRG